MMKSKKGKSKSSVKRFYSLREQITKPKRYDSSLSFQKLITKSDEKVKNKQNVTDQNDYLRQYYTSSQSVTLNNDKENESFQRKDIYKLPLLPSTASIVAFNPTKSRIPFSELLPSSSSKNLVKNQKVIQRKKNFKRLPPSWHDDSASSRLKIIQQENLPSAAVSPATVNFHLPIVNKEKNKQLLMKALDQKAILTWSEIFTPEELNSLYKIGEGVYGEVYRLRKSGDVIKLTPIEGDLPIMDGTRQQMTFDSVYSEVLVTKQLSDLTWKSSNNRAINYSRLKNGALVQGALPRAFVQQWRAYDEQYSSENICLDFLPPSQLWLLMRLEYAGTTLEYYKFKNFFEVLSAFQQICIALAAAEAELEFEHRDLHSGNVLIQTTPSQNLHYLVNKQKYTIQTHGVRATIIDFTVSRMAFENKVVFVDLSQNPEIFNVYDGEYQNEIYRMMQSVNGNKWKQFYPQSNLMWIHYLCIQFLRHIHVAAPPDPRIHALFLTTEVELRQTIQLILTKYGKVTRFAMEDHGIDTRSSALLTINKSNQSEQPLYAGSMDLIVKNAIFETCRC